MKVIRCPLCHAKVIIYCTKIKENVKYRYYKCPICDNTLKTVVEEKETVIKK